ncbi:hypothetical protein A3D42_01920 [Candidatus Nomurabacteria bacterium RIFCSPHIGHO2_02_FULL_41_18]|uniref:DUF1003 domain-containing protein n=1 Tax=Candidatus Nomurabacteria bacterium RIFCSPHIGHO2_02_FULL_41_18 TaxID=1801754 RepID=A0A1F6W5W7_9BACT|nr:MAG: hypothetical protein A2737_00485 [Candidatus Nomurabacteria bacterium RIFCSPHIGHO2_01_FULL_41_71]OGI77291.1 MAG: hypothetical protein A3D42_01920 [Candidatus Nomurabacteria bacterium RIFCSPHIGHO2_02_FULL_41_18]OGI89689.1 MAG: hypothetical protein A3B01_02645 [Candidatus Nomurabacteria bacterium RIFCSPLOWO2_01_FULL_41_52b]
MSQNHVSFLKALFGEGEEARRRIFRSIKAKANAKRTLMEKMADAMTSRFGSASFLLINAAAFVLWLFINTGQIKGIPIFDPYPFILLTTFVSLEAIILAIFVLISQNRSIKIDDLREEVDLQINLISAKEITKLMKMIAILLEKQGVDLSQDPELKKMLKPVSEEEIEKRLEKEIL